MNIHRSLVMAVYTISRDGVGDGSGLIIKSIFNCILLHHNDVNELASLPHSEGGGGGQCWRRTLGDIFVFFTTADDWNLRTGTGSVLLFLLLPGLQRIRRRCQARAGCGGLREVCRDACRSIDSGKHAPNPFRGLTLLTPPLFRRLQHFLESAGVPTQECQVHL